MRKRIILTVLSAIMLLSTVTACTKTPTKTIDPSLNTSHTLCAWFEQIVEANPDADPEKIAEKYVEHEWLKNMGLEIYSEDYPTEYTPFIYGLKEDFTIPEYKSVTHVTPQIFPNTYVSHIFVLNDGTDAEAFAEALVENTDLNFNVCMTSDECAATAVGNLVFYVVCDNMKEAKTAEAIYGSIM